MRVLQERIDALTKDLKSMQEEQAKTTKSVTTVDKAWNTFIKGFFGTLDVSIDETTKGMDGHVAYHWNSAPNGGPPYVNAGAKSPPGPYGRVSWMSMMSSNGSNVGYRGTHKIGSSDVNFIYQVSTSLDMAAAPGLNNTWTKSSNTVQGAIGLGDTYIGLRDKAVGADQVRRDVHALQDLDRPAESLLGTCSATTASSWAIPAATTGSSSARAWITSSSTTRPTGPVQLRRLLLASARTRTRTTTSRRSGRRTAPEGTPRAAATCS